MATRTTRKQVQDRVDTVNGFLGFGPDVTHSDTGSIHLGGAYGGWRVEQIINESGGISILSRDGYGTLREARIFLDGMVAALTLTGQAG